jgi:cytochrome c biogenesis protein CcmG/thiol:disulfide interchange protein DsbE
MSRASTDRPEQLTPDGGGRHRLGGAGRTIVALVISVVLLLVGVAVAINMGREDGTGTAFRPDGTRLGPVSGSEQKPLPVGTLLAFHTDEAVDVHDYLGRSLVLNFWASWCTPCVEEMPYFQQVADEMAGRVRFLGVNAQDSAEAAREFAAELGVTFDLARDPNGEYFAAVGGFGWPTTLLVDADGLIRYRHTGPLDADELRDLLETHLGIDPG